MVISGKQGRLLKDIKSPNKNEIYVLGSTQSGKTYIICLALILYAQELYEAYPNERFNGAIIGWSMNSVKSNIADVIIQHLKDMNYPSEYYKLNWGTTDAKYLDIYNIRFYFYSFNNALSYNNILGKPLLFEWVDESAKIYSSSQLQESFDQLPTRQMSYVTNPFMKTIHSFNVEGNENHPYKLKYIDGKPKAIHYTFFPFDNPKIDTKEAIHKVLDMFPKGSALQEQKVFNKWVIAEGKVFKEVKQCIITEDDFDNYAFREIGIGIDYGSANPTTFVPIALAYNKLLRRWELVRLEIYYHAPSIEGDEPTTEYYSNQLRLFLLYLKGEYPAVPIYDIVIDSEATHFHNRLDADNIPHDLADKYPNSVVEGVQRLQSLMHLELFRIYQTNSIKEIHQDGSLEYCNKDEGVVEFNSYQYDNIKASKSGVDCFKKEYDHQIDGTRYIIQDFIEKGKWYET